MDEAKRAELYARREEILAGKERQDRIRRRAEFVAMVPILSALEAAGDEYDSFGFNRLTGPLNWWACEADRFPMREKSRVDLPAEPAARDAVILAHLRERFGADDPVTIILRREEIVLTMRMPVLIRHLDTLFENAKSNWLGFTAPAAGWTFYDWLHRSSQRLHQVHEAYCSFTLHYFAYYLLKILLLHNLLAL